MVEWTFPFSGGLQPIQMKMPKKIVRGNFVGYRWTPISVVEMIQYFGIILKISILELNLGGYDAYWDKKISVKAGRNYSVQLMGLQPWARDVMTKHRFKQIRAAF